MNSSKRRRVRHVCPDCGRARQLQPSDAARTQRCQVCHCRRIAPLGFQATAAKHGRDFAIRAAARKRRQQPSSLEQRVEAALCQIPGIAWEREYAVERDGCAPYYVDFAVTANRRFLALEVNGSYAHRHDDEAHSLRTDTLFLYFDDVLVLTEEEVRSAGSLADHIRQRLFGIRQGER
jgi:hypothetical protein